jgi:hypothetical protein
VRSQPYGNNSTGQPEPFCRPAAGHARPQRGRQAFKQMTLFHWASELRRLLGQSPVSGGEIRVFGFSIALVSRAVRYQ